MSRIVIALIMLLLAGCANNPHDFVQSQVQNNLLEENWAPQVDTHPAAWKRHVDSWVWYGQPNALEQANRQAPIDRAMSTMTVRVCNFTHIKVNGDFQVQLDGRFQRNSVYLLGPNEEIRQVVVEVNGSTLNIHRVADENNDPQHVIVRIAVHNLQSLEQVGSGRVEGRFIRSNPLRLISSGSGEVFLAGKMNVRYINQSGSGNITLLGAYTPSLTIDTTGSGSLNISGRVGVESIMHSGTGNINIVGADTNALTIGAEGSGKIGIQGIMNLKQISASGRANVYLYTARSKNVYIYLRDKAQVGMAGETKSLYVDAQGSSFFAGRYLHSKYTYVRTREWAHINAAADDRAFATANGNSSIYIIGLPDVISPYVNDNAVVIPIEPPPITPTQILQADKKKARRFGGETYLP